MTVSLFRTVIVQPQAGFEEIPGENAPQQSGCIQYQSSLSVRNRICVEAVQGGGLDVCSESTNRM